MNDIDEAVSKCYGVLAKLGQEDPPAAAGAIVAAPQQWIDRVRDAVGAEPGTEMDTMCGVKVVVADAPGPSLVAADGRAWYLGGDQAQKTAPEAA